MRVELKKKNDPGFASTGAAVLYKNFIEFSDLEDFDTLIRTLVKKHKLKLSEVLSKCVQLNYQIDKQNNVININLNRVLADAENFSENVAQYVDTIKNKLGKGLK